MAAPSLRVILTDGVLIISCCHARLNQITSSSLLRVLGSCGKWFDASALLQLQSCAASKLDPFSFTATSDTCVESQWIQTLNLLDMATRSEDFQQVSLGNIAISASGEAEEWQEAIQLFSTSVARSVQRTMVYPQRCHQCLRTKCPMVESSGAPGSTGRPVRQWQ